MGLEVVAQQAAHSGSSVSSRLGDPADSQPVEKREQEIGLQLGIDARSKLAGGDERPEVPDHPPVELAAAGALLDLQRWPSDGVTEEREPDGPTGAAIGVDREPIENLGFQPFATDRFFGASGKTPPGRLEDFPVGEPDQCIPASEVVGDDRGRGAETSGDVAEPGAVEASALDHLPGGPSNGASSGVMVNADFGRHGALG